MRLEDDRVNYKTFIKKVERDLPLHFDSLDEWERIMLFGFDFLFSKPNRYIGVAIEIYYERHAEQPYQIFIYYITNGHSYGEEIYDGWADTLTSAYNQIYEKLKELTKEEIEVEG